MSMIGTKCNSTQGSAATYSDCAKYIGNVPFLNTGNQYNAIAVNKMCHVGG